MDLIYNTIVIFFAIYGLVNFIMYIVKACNKKKSNELKQRDWSKSWCPIPNAVYSSDGTKVYVVKDDDSVDVYDLTTTGDEETVVFKENIKALVS